MIFDYKEWGELGGRICFINSEGRTLCYAADENKKIIIEPSYYGHPKDGMWLLSGPLRYKGDVRVGIDKAVSGAIEKFHKF